MKNIHISDVISQSLATQTQIASVMGITQGAVSQALRSNRNIFLTINDSGVIKGWYEIKTKTKKSKPKTSKEEK